MWCEMENEPIQMLLHQVQHLYMRYAIKQVKDGSEKFHGGQAGILFVLKFKGGMSQKELANMLHLSAPSVTAAIQKMEAGGLVKREQDKQDQRVMRLTITPNGEEYVEHIMEAAKKAEALAMSNMSKEEQLLLRRLLKQMRDNLAEGKDVDYGKTI